MRRVLSPVNSSRYRAVILGAGVLLAAGVFAPGVRGQEAAVAPTLPVREYPKLWWDDAAFALSSPARWEQQDWLEFSAGSLAVVGTALVLDRPARNWTQRHTGAAWEQFANRFEPLGSWGAFAVIGGFYLEGKAMADPRAENTAVDALSASIVAAGIITPVLKEIAGRSRPRAGQGVDHFRPFSSAASFPSGHATEAFAVASVIAAHYDSPWVKGLAYGLAGLVGVARIDHNAHFASDVLAGALIGATVGRAVVRFNNAKRSAQAGKPVALVPWVGGGGGGLEISAEF